MRLARPMALVSIMTLPLAACATGSLAPHPQPASVTPERAGRLDRVFSGLVAEHGLRTAGAAIIRNGEVAWTGYYGEQSPGVPASASTRFNVASITKVVAAEAILRLVDDGRLSLDEPMARHWVDPDLADDPRHERLTPRMALTHTTGFPNWRFQMEDRKLRFVEEPGTTYGYSGEGFEYLARYAEEKLGRDFPDLVRELVFEPAGMHGASITVPDGDAGTIARATDEEGVFHGHFCRPGGWCREPGSYSAADDMVVSVDEYARFLIWVMNGEGYGEGLSAERDRVHAPKGSQATIVCGGSDPAPCPDAQGYGLGWEILDYGDRRIVSHGGSDWSELALGYFDTRSRDGVVIFLNAPGISALAAMPDAIRALDPGSPMEAAYRRRYEQAAAR